MTSKAATELNNHGSKKEDDMDGSSSESSENSDQPESHKDKIAINSKVEVSDQEEDSSDSDDSDNLESEEDKEVESKMEDDMDGSSSESSENSDQPESHKDKIAINSKVEIGDQEEESSDSDDSDNLESEEDKEVESKMEVGDQEDSSDSDDSDNLDLEEDKEVESKMDSLRKELSDVPFEELQRLQDRVGSKLYNEALFGKKTASKQAEAQAALRNKFKRANKNRPQEMSSKRRVGSFREVIDVKKKVYRDPRFDDLSGDFDEDAFSSNYKFINDIRDREKKQVAKEIKKTKNPDRKEQLKRLLQRMDQQGATDKRKESAKLAERERKKHERELIKQGKKPFFLKKSEEKKLELAEKYKQLKKSGKVEKYLSQKRKKNASKDRRHLPKSSGHQQY